MSIPVRPVTSFDGTSLNTMTDTAPRLTFWLVRGLDEAANVRGSDIVVPGTAGRTVRDRVRDNRVIEIEGHVLGVGATAAAQTDDFRDAMETLRALFDETASPAALVVGLEDGIRSATITCRTLNRLTRYIADMGAVVNVELEAVGADWSVA